MSKPVKKIGPNAEMDAAFVAIRLFVGWEMMA